MGRPVRICIICKRSIYKTVSAMAQKIVNGKPRPVGYIHQKCMSVYVDMLDREEKANLLKAIQDDKENMYDLQKADNREVSACRISNYE